MRWILSVYVPYAGGRGGQYLQNRVPRGGSSYYGVVLEAKPI